MCRSQSPPTFSKRLMLIITTGWFSSGSRSLIGTQAGGLLVVMAGLLGLEYGSTLPLCLSKHLDKTGHIPVSTPHVINRQIYGERSCSHSSDCDDGVSNEQSYLINHCCSSCLLNWSMMASSRSASVTRLR